MDRIRTLYSAVEQKLAGLDFGRLWPGFRPCGFALYTEEWVYLHSRVLPNDGSFRGNTAIRFENGYLAIWQVTAEDYENENILTANLVHEMFHVFQLERGESRFPNDLAALGEPMEADLLAMKLAENRLLAQALRLEDAEARRTALAGFCALREERRRRLGHLPELLPEGTRRLSGPGLALAGQRERGTAARGTAGGSQRAVSDMLLPLGKRYAAGSRQRSPRRPGRTADPDEITQPNCRAVFLKTQTGSRNKIVPGPYLSTFFPALDLP